MAGFKILNAKDAAAAKAKGRSEVSGPILREFIEATNDKIGAIAEVDAAAVPGDRKPDSLYQMLNGFALDNELPVKPFMREKTVYIERLESPRPKPVKAATAAAVETPATADATEVADGELIG